MKTPEEIKRGLVTCTELVMPADVQHAAMADALAYIQQLETENHQLLTKAQQLESTISQVSKALCSKEKATLKELLQAADQLKTRAHTIEAEPVRHGRWVDGIKCNCCGQVDTTKPNYCPNCGAKMDGGAK